MSLALAQAQAASARGEVPVGAVLLAPDGTILAADGNRTEANHDASAHAELLVLRAAAARLASPRLPGCTLIVTLEPCAMCAAAAAAFRVSRIIFGAYDPKGGAIDHGARIFQTQGAIHQPEIIGGVRETDAATLLRDFFRTRR
jgi:cytosine deaminase